MLNRIYRLTLLFLFFLLVSFNGNGQLVTTLQIPVTGVNQKSQLWNMVLVNPTPEAVDIQIELALYNNATNQKVLSAVTRVLTVNKGAKQIQYTDVSPVNYNYFGGTDLDRNPYGFLPAGFYKACFSFAKIVGDMIQPLAEECTELEVAPLSPPQLMLPEDNAQVDRAYPQFSWTTPVPQLLFRNLTYTLKVVEWLPGQGYTDAMEQNMPVLHERNLKQPFFDYPASAKAFEKNKKYLWQVTANDIAYSVKTDIWLFELSSQSQRTRQQSSYYIALDRAMGPVRFISNGLLKFKYINELPDTHATYRICSSTSRSETKLNGTINLKRGENFLDLDIEGRSFLKDGTTYLLELANSAGEKWLLPFIYYTNPEIDKKD